jgi:hypothetical protein
MKYLLFVFAKHVDQEEFIKFLGGEIGRVIESSDVKYYYGPESVIFTFNSNEDSTDIREIFHVTFGKSNIVYFLLPYEPDKMSYWMDENVGKHLFSDSEYDQKNEDDMETLSFNDFDNGMDLLLKEIINDDEIEKLRINVKHVKTVDQLLDKIIDEGYGSLLDSEIKLLNEYSKK